MTNGELGQLTYETYARLVGNKSVHGEDLLPWKLLPTHVSLAWMGAAAAVRGQVALEERQLPSRSWSES